MKQTNNDLILRKKQQLIKKFCEENHLTHSNTHDWGINIKTNDQSISLFLVKDSWLNTHTGERGRYRDLEEFLNYKFHKK
jgi:hypothetical protein